MCSEEGQHCCHVLCRWSVYVVWEDSCFSPWPGLILHLFLWISRRLCVVDDWTDIRFRVTNRASGITRRLWSNFSVMQFYLQEPLEKIERDCGHATVCVIEMTRQLIIFPVSFMLLVYKCKGKQDGFCSKQIRKTSCQACTYPICCGCSASTDNCQW